MEKNVSYEKTVCYADLDGLGNIAVSKLYNLINNDTYKTLFELGLTADLLKKKQFIIFNKKISVALEKTPMLDDKLHIQTKVKIDDDAIHSHTVILKNNEKICELFSEYEVRDTHDTNISLASLGIL